MKRTVDDYAKHIADNTTINEAKKNDAMEKADIIRALKNVEKDAKIYIDSRADTVLRTITLNREKSMGGKTPKQILIFKDY